MILNDLKKVLSSEINLDIHSTSKLSSVLIIIHNDPPKILMTKKSSHLKIHAGEIAFPGGKFEEDDDNLLHTAIRETKEELDLDIPKHQIIGQLEPVKTLNSNFTIVPFISIIDSLPTITCNSEVESILDIPVLPFLNTLRDDPDPSHNLIQEMYTFTFKEHIVWGASARMLKQIVDKMSKSHFK